MESLYFVLSWACHRKCRHCYDDRFRPYVRDGLEAVVAEGERAFRKIVANLPERMTYFDPARPGKDGALTEQTGRVVLSGGEVLLDPVRRRILHPLMEALQEKYQDKGGVRLIVQTTGDLVTEAILEELLKRGLWMISISGMDDFHVGHEGDKRQPLVDRLLALFDTFGISRSGSHAPIKGWTEEEGPVFDMFGANGEEWIGALWPRGRAFENALSTATFKDNFCHGWSGGLKFLEHRYAGSEVSIEPNGDVYPCCLKTGAPLGNLTEERLEDILDSLVGHPAFEAINAGRPERMGLSHGWDIEAFYRNSTKQRPDGAVQRNLCIGCEKFHREVLADEIATLRAARLKLKATG